MASNVGLGWALSAGGMISRTMVGLPDDSPYGYFNTGEFDPAKDAAGFENDNVDRTISDNVNKDLTYYQTTPSIVRPRGDRNRKEEGSKGAIIS